MFLFYGFLNQLADFGLAVIDGAQNKNNIKLSGTLGYVAPEYLLDGGPTKLLKFFYAYSLSLTDGYVYYNTHYPPLTIYLFVGLLSILKF